MKTPRDKELSLAHQRAQRGPFAAQVRKVVLKCSNCENVEEAASFEISIVAMDSLQVIVETGFTAAHIPGACKGNAFRAGRHPYFFV